MELETRERERARERERERADSARLLLPTSRLKLNMEGDPFFDTDLLLEAAARRARREEREWARVVVRQNEAATRAARQRERRERREEEGRQARERERDFAREAGVEYERLLQARQWWRWHHIAQLLVERQEQQEQQP